MMDSSKPRRLCVLLLHYGAPGSADELTPYAQSVLDNTLPLPRFLRRHLVAPWARRRARALAPLCHELGFATSAAGQITRQAEALQEELLARGLLAKVLVIMRHTSPRAAQALDEARRHWSDATWVALPLYPQYAHAITGSILRELTEELTTPEQERLLTINAYPADGGYLDAVAACVRETLRSIPGAMRHSTHIVFAAHMAPRRISRRDDPYEEHLARSIEGVYRRLAVTWPMHLVYQSTGIDTGRLSEGLHEKMEQLGREGVRSVVVVPITFLAEGLETLYGLDVHMREVAKAAGIMDFRRVRTPGTSATLICALANLVMHVLPRED